MAETENELWRHVPGWPYEVSRLGRVRRTEPENSTYPGKILRPATDRYGYRYVRLCRDGKVHDFKVHALVCTAFSAERPSSKHEVRHLNGLRNDNRAENLVWGTAKENAEDRDRHGNQRRGERCYQARLTNAQAKQLRNDINALRIGRLRVPGGTIPLLANKYGIPESTLYSIVRNRGYQ